MMRATARFYHAIMVQGHKRQVMCIAFSPDNSRAAIASQDGTWSVWNIDVRFRQQEDPKRLLQETQEVSPFNWRKLLPRAGCIWI